MVKTNKSAPKNPQKRKPAPPKTHPQNRVVLEQASATFDRAQAGLAAAWVVMVAYTLFLVFSAGKAHADNAKDLKAFIDNGKYPPAPPPPILKTGKPTYEQVRDAVASGAVQAGYVAIHAYSKGSNVDTHRIIFALEREKVIRWDSENQKWELVK